VIDNGNNKINTNTNADTNHTRNNRKRTHFAFRLKSRARRFTISVLHITDHGDSLAETLWNVARDSSYKVNKHACLHLPLWAAFQGNCKETTPRYGRQEIQQRVWSWNMPKSSLWDEGCTRSNHRYLREQLSSWGSCKIQDFNAGNVSWELYNYWSYQHVGVGWSAAVDDRTQRLSSKELGVWQKRGKHFVAYGRYDLVVFASAPDYSAWRRLISAMNSLEGVRSSETLVEAQETISLEISSAPWMIWFAKDQSATKIRSLKSKLSEQRTWCRRKPSARRKNRRWKEGEGLTDNSINCRHNLCSNIGQ